MMSRKPVGISFVSASALLPSWSSMEAPSRPGSVDVVVEGRDPEALWDVGLSVNSKRRHAMTPGLRNGGVTSRRFRNSFAGRRVLLQSLARWVNTEACQGG